MKRKLTDFNLRRIILAAVFIASVFIFFLINLLFDRDLLPYYPLEILAAKTTDVLITSFLGRKIVRTILLFYSIFRASGGTNSKLKIPDIIYMGFIVSDMVLAAINSTVVYTDYYDYGVYTESVSWNPAVVITVDALLLLYFLNFFFGGYEKGGKFCPSRRKKISREESLRQASENTPVVRGSGWNEIK